MEDIANRVAVSMEKEYLREQLNEKEKELSIINRSSAIITSTFDIQRIYDSFVAGLKEVVNVDWAAICIIEDNEIYFMAISSSIGSPWKVGERIPLKGTATEHVAKNRTPWIATDLALESPFTTGKYLLQHGLHSIAYLPLKAGSRITGSLAIGSHLVNGYNQRKVKLLEQLASQVAMPIENARLYAETAKMARNDELTGLLNRRSLNEILVSEVVRHSRYGGVFSLMVLDIDRFKSFNDTYGHLAGDKILREVGAVMKNTIREADQAFRYGGDEFAILLPQTSAEAASIVAERVRQEITSRAKIDNISVTISLGMASWPADGISPNDVIAAADSALYQAKHAGGNQSIVSSSLLDLVSSTATIDTKDSEAMSTIFGLAASVDARDHYTRSHSKRVCEFAVAIAEAINMEPLAIDRLSNCALLHDIGKIGINDEILKKPDKFSDQEMKIVREHAKLGATMVSHVRQLSTCVHGIMHHHERWDGTGYPKGIKGEEIPLESRILAISDAFVAMTSDRIYSKALSYNEAIEEMKRYSGSQFDPKLLEVFLELLNKMPRESVIIREG